MCRGSGRADGIARMGGEGRRNEWRKQKAGQGNLSVSHTRHPIPKVADANKNQGSKSVSPGASGRVVTQPSFTIVGYVKKSSRRPRRKVPRSSNNKAHTALTWRRRLSILPCRAPSTIR